MNNFDKTTRVTNTYTLPENGDIIVTIFDGEQKPYTIRLNDFHKDVITFGRQGNDIDVISPIVSHQHGRFHRIKGEWLIEDREVYGNIPSTNGLIYNNTSILSKSLSEGDFIRIDDGVKTIRDGVLFVVSNASSQSVWNTIQTKSVMTVGRDNRCDIVLPHVSISKIHANIIYENGRFYIIDNNSTNGIIVNNVEIQGKHELNEKDVIVIANAKLIFTSRMISYCTYKSGISVDAQNIVIRRGRGKKSFITGNDISLNIKPGELVAIIGGSGAGKSTILNAMCGYLPPTSGEVYINGVNLYSNFESLKKIIGYVPQSDIVYDDLSLYDTLSYTAKLRLPKDTTPQEREQAIDKAIEVVGLQEKKKSLIKALSGGQRKRASIAVELLSDPNLLFLDEPASCLDPGTERNLMESLRQMADNGKTVILVTHSTLQLKICDKIVFMGKGGNLTFFGSYDEAMEFFGVDDIVDVYNMITEDATKWKDYYNYRRPVIKPRQTEKALTQTKSKTDFQLPVLCSRYAKLIWNNKGRLALLFGIAPLCALFIAIVANGAQFEEYETTKSLLFSLSCSVSFVGILNSIQEVCKERAIVKREYMTGLSMTSYVLSKFIILGCICLIQSLLIIATFSYIVGLPSEGIIFTPFIEMFITTYLIALASTGMGLLVSCLVVDAAMANTIGIILLIPQILFSGIIFKLEDFSEMISWVVVCRWGTEAYGTIANLNSLDYKSVRTDETGQLANLLPHDAEDIFEFTASHLCKSWGILLICCIAFLILARFMLVKLKREKA